MRQTRAVWLLDARLKDGFHFEAVRQIAIKRLSNTRKICALLADELKQDTP